jgi:hypothetical protein
MVVVVERAVLAIGKHNRDAQAQLLVASGSKVGEDANRPVEQKAVNWLEGSST